MSGLPKDAVKAKDMRNSPISHYWIRECGRSVDKMDLRSLWDAERYEGAVGAVLVPVLTPARQDVNHNMITERIRCRSCVSTWVQKIRPLRKTAHARVVFNATRRSLPEEPTGQITANTPKPRRLDAFVGPLFNPDAGALAAPHASEINMKIRE